jgi:hypothetical protein
VRAVLSAALHRRRFRRQQRRSHDRHQPQRRQRTPLGQRNTCVQRSKITSTSCATRSGDALSWAHAATAAHGAFNARVASPRSSARHGLQIPSSPTRLADRVCSTSALATVCAPLAALTTLRRRQKRYFVGPRHQRYRDAGPCSCAIAMT